ncbi:hypothetical protein GCM10022199_08580 [Marihabitans asiaticum]|uniref:Peptidase M23-like protein n=1 Tax=Marihabitans asiaticum TaxID=415218 RepID=A0A560WH52_9MICO|nr:M23 family metallopeptidase [Marihabitans asiaticum]TWD16886.1 peptidase M23-like protein [Marihabitans asiaticum]
MDSARRAVARYQTWWLRLAFLTVVAGELGGSLGPAGSLLAVVFVAMFFVRAPRQDHRSPVHTQPPVLGRWVPINSPGSKVPSHGIRAYGQAFAIDILHPRSMPRPPAPGWGLSQRPPEAYSCFGEPVHAMAAGTVVRASDGLRDHRTRSTWPGLIYMLTIEAAAREVLGAGFVVGNHVVIDHGDGVYSAYAHLQQGSVTVSADDQVTAGEQIALVGNSGNTSEPHLHVQLMDHSRFTAAAGLPFRWENIRQRGKETDESWSHKPVSRQITPGLPADGQVFVSASRPPGVPTRTEPS